MEYADITVSFIIETNCFLKKKPQLQIENSGFVKTCDEHVPSD